MEILLYSLVIFSSLLLIGAVLLQPSKGGGISALGGTSQSVFGSTGGTTFLFRATMFTAAIILLGSVLITRLKVKEGSSTVINTSTLALPEIAPPVSEAAPTPAESPAAPSSDKK